MLALLIFILSYLLPDRVFRFDCSTRQVYEEGAKEVALSVVSGINCKYTNLTFLVTILVLLTCQNLKIFVTS